MSDRKPTPSPQHLVVRVPPGVEDGAFSHPLNPRSEMHGVDLARKAGLRRIGVWRVRVPPGKESFVPHLHWSEEEFVFVLAGAGVAEVGDETFPIGPGDFLGFPPLTHAHHVRNTGGEDLVYLAGGENHDVEVADLPTIGKRLVRRSDEAVFYDLASGMAVLRADESRPRPLPAELVLTARARAAIPEESSGHPLNPSCEIHGWVLGRETGLRRVGVNWLRVPAGKESTAPHFHEVEEEFAYVLEGRGEAEIGGELFPIGPGDFLGFPAGSHAHALRSVGPGDLVFVGGGTNARVDTGEFTRPARRWLKAGGRGLLYPVEGEKLG